MDETTAGRGYHMGNVREQLLAAARRMLDEEGRGRLSLRAIAGRTGVAPATVYHHFADKQALMAELAVEGFRELTAAMRAELARQDGEVRAAWRGYMTFLERRPALYELMYEARDTGARSEVLAAEHAAFRVMAQAMPGSGPEHGDHKKAAALWACARGVGALALARGVPGATPDAQLADTCEQGLETLFAAG